MKKTLDKLLEYGTGFAAIVVLTLAGLVFILVVAVAIVLTKILVFIK